MSRVTQVTVSTPVHKLGLVRYSTLEVPPLVTVIEVAVGEDPLEVTRNVATSMGQVWNELFDKAVREHLTVLAETADAPTCNDAKKLLDAIKRDGGFRPTKADEHLPDVPDPGRPAPRGFRVRGAR
jgi:hypothetical protein